MKHAILITCYKDIDFINQIIEYFDYDFDFFIHIDKKCKEKCNLKNTYRVHIYKQYKVYWGGLNHCKSILLLIKEAVNKGNYDYFHLITCSDFPIKPLSEFKSFFEQHKEQSFMEYFKLPRENWWLNGGEDRIRFYWFGVDFFDMRKWRKFHNYSIKIQRKILKIKRIFSFFNANLYGGATYWSLHNNAVKELLNYLKENPKYLNRFKYTAIPEEIIFPTILLNLQNVAIQNNTLRYIDWQLNQSSPKILTIDHFDNIIKSDCLFARKFNKEKSKSLLNKLKNLR
jgi:hypothetical protein